MSEANTDAVERWLLFAGPRVENVSHRTWLTTQGGLPWFVQALSLWEPIVFVLSTPTQSRLQTMQSAISSVLVCLRHPAVQGDLGIAADLLLERGHSWLGEPLALWLVGEHEKAIDLLLDRVPVLPEFAEWAREDALRTRTSLRVRVDGQEQHVTFSFPRAHGKTAALAIIDDLNSQLAGVVARAEDGTITLTSTATGSGSDVGSQATAEGAVASASRGAAQATTLD